MYEYIPGQRGGIADGLGRVPCPPAKETVYLHRHLNTCPGCCCCLRDLVGAEMYQVESGVCQKELSGAEGDSGPRGVNAIVIEKTWDAFTG
jgi:hypothetical protein